MLYATKRTLSEVMNYDMPLFKLFSYLIILFTLQFDSISLLPPLSFQTVEHDRL
jgi:hypothetical protein